MEQLRITNEKVIVNKIKNVKKIMKTKENDES